MFKKHPVTGEWLFMDYPIWGGWLPFIGFRKVYVDDGVAGEGIYNSFGIEWLLYGFHFLISKREDIL